MDIETKVGFLEKNESLHGLTSSETAAFEFFGFSASAKSCQYDPINVLGTWGALYFWNRSEAAAR